MDKEYLEAFDRIASHTEYDNDGSYDCVNFEDDCKLVDDALKRLEEIDNVKPSEALECLEEMWELSCDSRKPEYTLYDTIKQALLKTQELKSENNVLLEENKDLYVELAFAEKQYKELIDCIVQYRKVLDIIKEKEVNIPFLKSATTFDKYNKAIELKSFFGIALTEEDFNLLKEAFR